MKCSFCSSNIPDGSELCPECGMIISLDSTESEEISVPGYVPNIFGSEPIKAPEVTVYEEAPAEELTIEVPEYNPESIVVADEAPEEAEEAYDEPEETPSEEEAETEEAFVEQEESEEADAEETEGEESYEVSAPALAEDSEAEEFTPPEYDPDSQASYAEEAEPYEEAEYEDISSVSSDADDENATFDEVAEESFVAYEEQEEIEVITPVIVPVEAETDYAPEEIAEADDSEELEEVNDDDDDTYIGSGRKGNLSKVIVLCLLLVCLAVAGGYIVKKVMPERQNNTTEPGVAVIKTATDSVKDDEEATTAADDETTESELTTEQDVTADATTEPSTEDVTVPTTEEVTEPSTEAVTEPSTTKPATTKPSTTKPSTTKPSTTKPSTTKPGTTKPSTTVDPYGINGAAKIQKPSKYLSSSYLAYTTKKVDMVGGPYSSSDWIQALGKGAEVKVLAKEKGYCYIYSTRFGTYGWVSSSSISEDRPTAQTTSTNKNTVQPDKSGSGETKYTTYSLNLRKGPGKDYAVIKTVPINYPVKVIGYKSGASGWAYVTDLTSGINGWVSTEYLK